MTLHRQICPWLTALFLLLMPGPSLAGVEAGVEFDESKVIDVAGRAESLELCSTGLLRYRRIFKGYVAGFYREDCSAVMNSLGEASKRLELSYFWSIPGDKFGVAAEQLLRETLEAADFAALELRMRRLHAAYVSVEPGDRYALTYVPRRGTELALNGRPLAVIEGEDFARAYFGIWLGEKPIDEKLRNALLADIDTGAGLGASDDVANDRVRR